jgi:hypothetical protein
MVNFHHSFTLPNRTLALNSLARPLHQKLRGPTLSLVKQTMGAGATMSLHNLFAALILLGGASTTLSQPSSAVDVCPESKAMHRLVDITVPSIS